MSDFLKQTAFPAPGHSYEVSFGAMAFHLDFDPDGKRMTFRAAANPNAPTETIHYTAVPIRPGVFMVYWAEASGTTVVHVEDFEQGVVHTNITGPDLSFTNLSGTLKQLT